MKNILAFLFLVISTLVSCTYMHSVISAEVTLINKENKCIAEYISAGIERNKIKTYKGTCYLG